MPTADVVIYDEHCGWSPSLNASKGTGGYEVHMVQIASWLAAMGLRVVVFGHNDCARMEHALPEHGVIYLDSRITNGDPWSCAALITCRASSVPTWVTAQRTVTASVDDPRPCPERFAHLRGRSTLVCVSEWQAGLFRDLGHECVVIPPPIWDETYRVAEHLDGKVWGRHVCLSAWNKGTQETLDAWRRLPKRPSDWQLLVGSPYSHPPDAAERCCEVGAVWLGTLTPDQVTAWMVSAEAVFRVNVAPETFGVTDAIAEVLGCRVHCLCTNGVGAIDEVLESPYVTSLPYAFRHGVLNSRPYRTSKDFRVSTIMPRWLPVLFGG
jgi:hypothetical protein